VIQKGYKMDDTASFGHWVRRQRKALDLTQKTLAQMVSCATVTISKIERDERRPSLQMAERLADCLSIPASSRATFIEAGLGQRPVDALPLPQQPVAAPSHNLPHYLTAFIGRVRESDYLRQQLQEQRLITLTGVGGSGKTRLAVHVARQCVRQGIFPGGVWLVELAELTDPGQILPRLSTLLAVPVTADDSLYEALCVHIQGRNMLLVLDNCEHLVAECAQLADRLLRACPQLVILATSREPLRLTGEKRYPVPPLAFPDIVWREPNTTPEMWHRYEAINLFCRRATAVQPDFRLTTANMTAVASICRHLSGIPLALELAAANIAQFSPAEIAQRLPQVLGYLTAGSRAVPPHQQTLRATIAWSYDLLSAEAQALLLRLAIFNGGWTREAAQFVSQVDGNSFHRQHTELIDKSLVTIRPVANNQTRYDLLETIRQFAMEKLNKKGEATAVRQRHFAYYEQLLQQAESAWGTMNQGEWTQWLESEQANLRAALLWSQSQPGLQSLATAVGILWYMQAIERLDRQAAVSQEEAIRLRPARQRLIAAAVTLAHLQGNSALVKRLTK
jgi:predicted ATPase/DNA-binding XRE family transcriptional regulator